jgi:hypothetical protein
VFRLGDRDPDTGLYWVIGAEGAIEGLGRKLFDEEVLIGDPIVAEPRTDGTWLIVGRDTSATSATTNPTNDRAKKAIGPLTAAERQSPTKAVKGAPYYRRFELWNEEEPEEGDWDLMRIQLTACNWILNNPFGVPSVYAPPPAACPARMAIDINGTSANIEYPGISTTPTPLITIGGKTIAWAYGETEPSNTFLWGPTTGSLGDPNTAGPWGYAWHKVTCVVDLKAAKSVGIGTITNPLLVVATSDVVSGDAAFFPIETHEEPGFYVGEVVTILDKSSVGRLIWRVNFDKKKSVNFLNPPPTRTSSYCYPVSGNSSLGWFSGTPYKFGKWPQFWAINSSYRIQATIDGGYELATGEVGRVEITYPALQQVADWYMDPPNLIPGPRAALFRYAGRPIPLPGSTYPENFLLWPGGQIPAAQPWYVLNQSVPIPKPRGKAPLAANALLQAGNPRIFGMLGGVHSFIQQ